jgi:cephalosporin-C deacetylase
MMLLVLGLALGGWAALAATQDVELTVRTDRPDAVYAKGETVTFIIELKDKGQPVEEATLGVDLSTTGFPGGERRQVVLKGGEADVTGSQPNPGMLWIRVTYQPEGGKEVTADAGAAFSPEEVKPSMPPPDDFDEFWSAQKAALDAVPMNAVLTPVPSEDEGCEVFDVSMEGPDGTKVTGYLAKPVGPGPFPGLVKFFWSGVYSLEARRAVYDAQAGFLAFHMNPHGIENGKPREYYRELDRGRLANYAHQGRESREKSYLRQMFLRCYRAAEFVASRPEWDGKHLLSTGHSMGGGQALAAAALSPHVTAVAVDAAAMCDHTAFVAGRMAGWPFLVPVRSGVPDPAILTASRYVDGVNFATRITVPAVVSTGFKDLTCPSSTEFAVYNALRGPKQLLMDPHTAHSATRPEWGRKLQELMRAQGGR